MRKVIFVSFILACFTISFSSAKDDSKGKEAASADISVSGKILDAVTGELLAGVAVSLEETDKIVYTDFNGNFKFTGLTPGEYTIKTTFISYQETSSRVDLQPNVKNEVNLKLKNMSL